MNEYVYSARHNAFFPVDMIDKYKSEGWDLSDAKEVIKILSVSLWLNRHKEKSVLPEMMGCLRGQIFLHPRMKNLLKLLNQKDSY
ncbi:phage tail protein [Escherichia coli]|uniref:phage tail protein n=1 Tax=Escherichia coli TaxID=562 RepID=UPI003D9C9C71